MAHPRPAKSAVSWRISSGPSLAFGQGMTPQEMKSRTKTFAVEVIKFARTLTVGDVAEDHIVRQLVRSGTAVGANYRASCRAKSTGDFISKMTTVEEETDETSYWLEVLVEGNLVGQERVETLMNEADQLIRIVVASIKTARGRKR